jgi:hypothetical protein
MAAATCAWSVVGVIRVMGVPENDIRPRLIPEGTRPTKCLAVVCMAWKRVGVMSVACMDSETSSAIITVARSRGTRARALGEPRETMRVASASTTTPNAVCRRQPSRFGTSDASRDTLVKRAA